MSDRDGDALSLAELDARHQEESAAARARIERAEGYVDYYRSRMTTMQESFAALAARESVADIPAVRSAFERVRDETDADVRAAGRLLSELEDDYRRMILRQADEREDVLRDRWTDTG